MAITQRDVMLLFTMSLAVVSMSFVFPALGLGGDQVAENDIPELDIDESAFDLTGEFPEPPGGPREGNLTWIDSRNEQLNQVYPRGDTTNGIEIALLPPSAGDPLQISIAQWKNSNLFYQEQINFSAEGDYYIFVNESMGMTVSFEVTRYNDTDPENYAVHYNIRSLDTQNAGWLEGVPVLGAATEGVLAVASVIGWFVEVVAWGSLYLIELVANTVAAIAAVGIYFVNLLTWLTSTYTAIVGAAQSWASVFVALPGILLSVVLGKFVLVAFGR